MFLRTPVKSKPFRSNISNAATIIANVTFRNAVKSDIPQLYTFAKKLSEHHGTESLLPYTADDLEKHFSSRPPWFHAIVFETKENGRTNFVGCSVYCQTYAPFCTRTAYLNGFYIVPEWRRKNITSRIYDYYKPAFANAGIEFGYGTLYVSNEPSKKLTAKNGFEDSTKTQGIHEMSIDLKNQTFTKFSFSSNITLRNANIRDCGAISQLFLDSRNYKIAAHPVSLNAEKLQRDGFTNNPYFDAIVAVDNTKFDKFGNNNIIGCALYTKALPFFMGKTLHLASICVQPEYDEVNVDRQLWKELEMIANANGCNSILFGAWESTPCYKYAKDIGAHDYVTSDPQTSIHSITLKIDKRLAAITTTFT